MKHQVFRKMVERAIAGEKEAMEQLLFLCKPSLTTTVMSMESWMRTAGKK